MSSEPKPLDNIGGVLAGLLTVAPGLIWLERRLLPYGRTAMVQNRAGPFGCGSLCLLTRSNFFFKEDWIPPFADKPVFVIAPGNCSHHCIDEFRDCAICTWSNSS